MWYIVILALKIYEKIFVIPLLDSNIKKMQTVHFASHLKLKTLDCKCIVTTFLSVNE